MSLKIITAPDAILRQKASRVESVDLEVQNIMTELLHLLPQSQGIGLAAPQVGISKQILVIDLQDRTLDQKNLCPLFMANPQITKFSDEQTEDIEGCLSLPTLSIKVKRSESILVNYLDYDNKKQELHVSGFLARVIQHEIDHLKGILLIDYLSSLKKDTSLRKLKKLKKMAN